MDHRERVLRTLCFEATDRAPYDLMEGAIWPELAAYFALEYGLQERDEILDWLNTDLRWIYHGYDGPEAVAPQDGLPEEWALTYSDALYARKLAQAESVADVEALPRPDPSHWHAPDARSARRRWPHHAIVYTPPWMPLFCGACEAFGMEEALAKMLLQPALFEAFVRTQHAYYVQILAQGLAACREHVDLVWLGDDYASQRAMLMRPALWRRLIKPCLAEQVQMAREAGLLVMFHSCGAVRPILPDLIEIGVNALLVFQVTATDMAPEAIAEEFGGRLAFYGGIDCQQILTQGTLHEVRAAVRRNVRAFEPYGGYIVANCHHGIANIRPENVIAMCRAAAEIRHAPGQGSGPRGVAAARRHRL
jgi:uroporphyrinogen decarboxylase